MSEVWTTIFGLIGGLALFLYGMNNMSDALQKAAGDKMKQILGFLTRNPIMGALAGAIVTAVLQSSSATTVMVIGFVSAGLMSLPQAISVIFGANIGTTMTAQLMAFKISNYIYPIIFIGFIMNFVSKNEKVKNIGTVIFSFGLLFEGIEIMGGVMKPLASSPIFINAMSMVQDIPVLGVLLGAIMTLVVQSSSATIAVLQNFASQAGADGVTSVMGLTGAIPILLGDNIGTTITALLASIGQSRNAKRTAIAHSIFNISGSVVFLFFIKPFAAFVEWISPKGVEVEIISRQIANAHTTFNIVCTLVWLPLIPLMVKIVTKLIPGDDGPAAEMFHPKYISQNVLGHPAAALYMVTKELSASSEDAQAMITAVRTEVSGREIELAQQNFDVQYTTVKKIQQEIEDFLTKLFAGGTLTEEQSEQAADLLYISTILERVADRCEEIAQKMRSLRNNGKALSEFATEELLECFDIIFKMFTHAMVAVENGSKAAAKEVHEDRIKMRKAEKKFKKAHAKRVKNGICDASLTADFTDILYSLERIADNCTSVAEEALENLNFKDLEISEESIPVEGGASVEKK